MERTVGKEEETWEYSEDAAKLLEGRDNLGNGRYGGYGGNGGYGGYGRYGGYGGYGEK